MGNEALRVEAGTFRWPDLDITLQQDLANAGAKWRNAEVVVDGNVITSRKPDDIPAFSEAVVKALVA